MLNLAWPADKPGYSFLRGAKEHSRRTRGYVIAGDGQGQLRVALARRRWLQQPVIVGTILQDRTRASIAHDACDGKHFPSVDAAVHRTAKLAINNYDSKCDEAHFCDPDSENYFSTGKNYLENFAIS